MNRIVPGLAAFLILASSGLVHGLWTGRWRADDRDLARDVANLGRVPASFGDWTGDPTPLDRETLGRAGLAAGSIWRFVHGPGGGAVSVLLVCGRPGPVSVHTPDVCYAGAGYAMEHDPTRFRPTEIRPPAEFWTADFRRAESTAPGRLRIFWSWSNGGPWQAPTSPRLAFGADRALYKLYVVRDTTGSEGAAVAEDDAIREFLGAFLPALDRALFPERAATNAAGATP
jgi:hypothetical protein